MECVVNFYKFRIAINIIMILILLLLVGWIVLNIFLVKSLSKEEKYEPINIFHAISDSLHDIRCKKKNTRKM